MRAALYIRVSSAGQVRDGYSLELQEEMLRSFCDREGMAIAQVYREGGQTGSNLDRERLRQPVTGAEAGLFDMVLIFRVDRFSRDPADLRGLRS